LLSNLAACLLCTAGNWPQALALAPAVSHAYWRELAQRRVQGLRAGGAGSWDVLPLMLAAGLASEATGLLRDEGLLGEAAEVASVCVAEWVVRPHRQFCTHQQHCWLAA
jgi:hypothetical protein